MIRSILLLSLISTLLFLSACESDKAEAVAEQTTWVHTYIKATEGKEAQLEQFIELNWFAMDSAAVEQGLFNDYKLWRNSSSADSLEWDVMVAVEYYTAGTYADIQDEWQEIRSAHETVLVDGFNFQDLGYIIRSETLQKQ